ncbi:MAG: aspartate--ammonia ligase [Clostridiales bacterium]|nr:aspartate--ammonia ligase [Clostridiales bacterium]
MQNGVIIPDGYKSVLSLRETQQAIKYIKDVFQQTLASFLVLDRVTAPLIVPANSGINDDLNGVERKVDFSIAAVGCDAEIVQSLAKWKRLALYRYGYGAGEGIYTDMNAVRRDDAVDNIHSVFVDQWDWEKVITREDRTVEYLKDTVCSIVKAVVYANRKVRLRYPKLDIHIAEKPYFITAEELRAAYPDLSPKAREREICRAHGTVFIIGIGDRLSDGNKHDNRAPDYDDWSLNGDLLIWNGVLDDALEISSMGVRADAAALRRQLTECGATDRYKHEYHRLIDQSVLPYTIGGGIGQSRLCMLMLGKAHIGEVQASIWSEQTLAECRARGVELL